MIYRMIIDHKPESDMMDYLRISMHSLPYPATWFDPEAAQAERQNAGYNGDAWNFRGWTATSLRVLRPDSTYWTAKGPQFPSAANFADFLVEDFTDALTAVLPADFAVFVIHRAHQLMATKMLHTSAVKKFTLKNVGCAQ